MATERRKAGPRHQGRQPKHGARALSRRVTANALDRRTGIARDFHGHQDGLAADRGGWGHTSAAERMAIEVAAMEMVILRALFTWAVKQPSIITEGADGPRLIGPLAKGFTSHAGALTRALATLGMRPDPIERLPDLRSYLEQQAANAKAAPPGCAPPAAVTIHAVDDPDAAEASTESEAAQ